jgi:Tol biopolymer transport system component
LVYDFSNTSAIRRLTLEGHNRFPVWSGDSQRIAFQSDRESDLAIFVQRADGGTAAERLTKPDSAVAHIPESWSPDGRTLLFSAMKDAIFSLWTLSLDDKKVMPFGNVRSAEPIGSTFSPDGRWVAYTWNDTPGGVPTPNRGVYVQPFPATGVRYQVPKEYNDFHPAWGATVEQLFYIPTSTRLSVVNVQTQPTFTFGKAMNLPAPATRDRISSNVRDYDVMPDGRFVSTVPAGDEGISGTDAQIRVVLNWLEELKQRVPVH